VVCFGPQGVLLAGRYLLLAGMNDTLLGVGLVPGSPPSLRFVVRPFQWGWRQPPEELRVPVPPGRVGEAADLVERYRRVHGLRADDAPKHVRIPRV
jgi:hypothetical protein